jgi:hypothetical protein
MKKTIFVLMTALVLASTGVGTRLEAASTESTVAYYDYQNGVQQGQYERAAASSNDDLIGPAQNAYAQKYAALLAEDSSAFDYWRGYIDGLGPVYLPDNP